MPAPSASTPADGVLLHQVERCRVLEELAGEQGLQEDSELLGCGHHGAGRPTLAGVPFARGEVKGRMEVRLRQRPRLRLARLQVGLLQVQRLEDALLQVLFV